MWLAYDTKIAIGVSADMCENRSLWYERFAGGYPSSLDERTWTSQLRQKPPLPHRHEAWRAFLLAQLPETQADMVFGRLLERLELARPGRIGLVSGLSLDACSGIPYLPGTVLRRAARGAAWHRMTEVNAGELAARLCELVALFGWNEMERAGHLPVVKANPSLWPELKARVQGQLQACLNSVLSGSPCHSPDWVTTFGGLAQFLPAYPWELSHCELELTGRSPQGFRPEKGRAGTGSPAGSLGIPAGVVMIFTVAGPTWVRTLARRWLFEALAGGLLRPRHEAPQGRFDVSPGVQNTCLADFQRQRETLRRTRQVEESNRARERAEAARNQAEAERQAALENMSPQEREDFGLCQLTEDQFRARLERFARDLTAKEQLPMIRVLRGPRLAAWEELKRRAVKGGHWAQIEQAVRAAAKKAKQDKMP